jgi:hypothetical protein
MTISRGHFVASSAAPDVMDAPRSTSANPKLGRRHGVSQTTPGQGVPIALETRLPGSRADLACLTPAGP